MVRRPSLPYVLVGALLLCASASAEDAKIKFEVKELKKQHTLVVKKTVKIADIKEALSEAYGKVFTVKEAKNIVALNETPMARYGKTDKEGMVELECGIIVPEGTKGEGDVVAGELPAGKVAFTIHAGPYENLPKTHEALNAALGEKGLTAANIRWEFYVSDPGTEPKDLKTEVYLVTEPKK